MKNMDLKELNFWTAVFAVNLLTGIFLILATHQMFAGVPVNVIGDVCRALCFSAPCIVIIYIVRCFMIRKSDK